MTHTEWTEETLKPLPVFAEESGGVKLVMVGTPDGRIMVDDVVQAEYNSLVALLAESHVIRGQNILLLGQHGLRFRTLPWL